MKSQPYYMIDFSASCCYFEIKINDYPIITLNLEGQVATAIPINYAILESGEQTISATIFPLLGDEFIHPNAELKFDIKLFDVSNDFVFQNQFGDYKSPLAKELKNLPIVKYTNVFQAEVPYEQKAWQDGEILNELEDVEEKLFLAYQKLYNIIKSGEHSRFIDMLARRESNMEVSMYLSKEESENRMVELIQDFENGFEIMPIDETSIFHIYGNGRVAMLKKINGESALSLYNKETKDKLMLEISFYIPRGKVDFEVI